MRKRLLQNCRRKRGLYWQCYCNVHDFVFSLYDSSLIMKKTGLYIALLFCFCLVSCENSSPAFIGEWNMQVKDCRYIYEFSKDGLYSCTMAIDDFSTIVSGKYQIEKVGDNGSCYLRIYDLSSDGTPLSWEMRAVAKAKGKTLHLMFTDNEEFLILRK